MPVMNGPHTAPEKVTVTATHTEIKARKVSVSADLDRDLLVTDLDAAQLDRELQDAITGVLRPYL